MKSKSHSRTDLARERHGSLSRRHFLRGLGACIALPALQSLLPVKLLAAEALPAGALATTATGAPLRMAFVYFPNGAIPAAWWPEGGDRDFSLGRTLEPLASSRPQLQVLSGLDDLNALAGPDGGGDHARANRSVTQPGSITSTELYFYPDDLEAAIHRFEVTGAHLLRPLARKDWGDEAAYFADPDGNVLVLARPLDL